MPTYEFVTVDVFTDRRFGGNPLAVFPDAHGLSDEQINDHGARIKVRSQIKFLALAADALPDPHDDQVPARGRAQEHRRLRRRAGHGVLERDKDGALTTSR